MVTKLPPPLSLPAEIREIIWEYTLIEPEAIRVTRTLQEPGLLSACLRTRHEAQGLWYSGNRWSINVHDCDATLLVKWMRQCRRFASTEVMLYAELSGGVDWARLLTWLEIDYDERDYFTNLTIRSSNKNVERIVNAAHMFLLGNRGRSFEVTSMAVHCLMMAIDQRLIVDSMPFPVTR